MWSGRLQRRTRDDIATSMRTAVTSMNLVGLEDRSPHELSGGHRLTLLTSNNRPLSKKPQTASEDAQASLARLTQFAKTVTVKHFPQCDWA